MNWLMNGPLLLLAVGSIFAGLLCQSWVTQQVNGSVSTTRVTGAVNVDGHAADSHGEVLILGLSEHTFMIVVSVVVSLGGIALAAYFHWLNRAVADRIARQYTDFVRVLRHKFFVDELYDAVLVRPLRLAGNLFHIVDRLIIDGLVALISALPRLAGMSIQTAQRGFIQGYGLGMAVGTGIVLLVVIVFAK